jgi:hypothetical protein
VPPKKKKKDGMPFPTSSARQISKKKKKSSSYSFITFLHIYFIPLKLITPKCLQVWYFTSNSFFSVLGFELRAFTLSHSTSLFFSFFSCWVFSR